MPLTQYSATRFLWFWIGAIILIDVVWMVLAGVTVDLRAMYDLVWIAGACLAIILSYRAHKNSNVYLFAHTILQMCCIGIPLGILSYLSSRLNLPLTDDTLIAIDRWIGFDWRQFVEWVDRQPPIITKILTFSYNSFGVQIVFLVCLSFVYHYSAHAQRFVIAFFIAAALTIALAAIFPAVAGYVHYDIDVTHFKNAHPAAARVHETLLLNMRSHSEATIAFPIAGLVTFPSFHSSLTILLIYISWPFKKLRLLFIPLNVLMLISTPIDGGHYLIDVIGGLALAFLALAIARRALPPDAPLGLPYQ